MKKMCLMGAMYACVMIGVFGGFAVAFAGAYVTVPQYLEYIQQELVSPVTVGFDLDDTLLDNQPSWIQSAEAVNGKIFTPAFWAVLNNSTKPNYILYGWSQKKPMHGQ